MKEEFDEYLSNISQLINEEVERRVKNAIDNYEEIVDENSKLRIENNRLTTKIMKLDDELNKAKQEYFDEGYKKAQREIFDGFSISDKVWFPIQTVETKNCGTCNGKGEINVLYNYNMMKVTCPHCKGYGRNNFITYVAEEAEIVEINCKIYKNRNNEEVKECSYYVKYGNGLYKEMNKLFATREECEQFIENKNEE
mgnify:CR=1 FL=1